MQITSAVLKLFAPVAVALCLAPPNSPTNSQSVGKTTGERASLSIFDEVAEDVGLKFRHYNGMTGKLYLPEIMGAGAALFDFDNDGDLDVFLVQGAVLEPGDKANRTLFPRSDQAEPRGRLFRNDFVIRNDASRTLRSILM